MDSNLLTLLCIFGAIIVALVVFFVNAIRIVPEYQRLVVFRAWGVALAKKAPD